MIKCTCCGQPTDRGEEHHVDQQRGNNDPDNLTTRCLRCHHARTHENDRRVDNYSQEKYGPASPSTGPPGGI